MQATILAPGISRYQLSNQLHYVLNFGLLQES